jgi:2'-5' RNA ligase
MADRMRTFIAIDLPDPVRKDLAGYLRRISGGKRDYKWVAVENLHITMAFLGSVDYEDVNNITSAMERAAGQSTGFPARLGAVGTFPSVIWVGLSEGDKECRGVYQKLREALMDADFRLDDKRYHPHITLGRSRRRMVPEERKWFEGNEPPTSRPFKVEELVLFESRLHPKGPEYIPLQRVKLGG